MQPEAQICLQRRKPMWNGLYYNFRPFIPRRLQVTLRRAVLQRKLHKVRGCWPIEPRAGEKPPGFRGWPDGKQFCLVLTHDVESRIGYDRCRELALLEKRLGFRSAFNFVARKYPVSSELRAWLVQEGFEVGVHGLYHDGKLYASQRIFQERAKGINEILRQWGAVGFRSPAMHYKAEWLHDLNIEYDCSTFDTDPFEPEGSAYHSIFPHIVTHSDGVRSYVELPYTLPQDFTLFVMLQFQDISIWYQKLDWIAEHGGMALVLTHPDYMQFDDRGRSYEEYPVAYYESLLRYIRARYTGRYWPALPSEVARFWREQGLSQGREMPLPVALFRQRLGDTQVASKAVNPMRSKDNYYPVRDKTSQRYIGKMQLDAANAPRRPLKVAMVGYTFYETDNRVMRYARTLAQRGDTVEALALRRPGQVSRETLDSVQVFRIQDRVLDETGRISYLTRITRFLWRSAVFLTRSHLRKPYDFIHIHSVPDFEVFAALVPKLLGASVILDIHDLVPEFYGSKFQQGTQSILFKLLLLCEKLSCRFADHVIISNHLWEKTLTRRSIGCQRCLALINYPDSRIFYPRERSRTDGEFRLIYPGTLNWHQGLDLAIQAIARLKDEIPSLRLQIYGEGEMRPELERMARELGLNGMVSIMDPVPLNEIAEVMAQADVGIVPKRANSFGNEAFSTKILEFMSAGIPVIAADTKIDKYYFNDHVLVFFKSGDVQSLCDRIGHLYRDHDYRRDVARAAFSFSAEMSWNKREHDYVQLVDRLTERSQ